MTLVCLEDEKDRREMKKKKEEGGDTCAIREHLGLSFIFGSNI
jgi:hypothetical protein